MGAICSSGRRCLSAGASTLRHAQLLTAAGAAEVVATGKVAARWVSGFGAETISVPSVPSAGAVLLVHGFGSNKSHFTALERSLLANGFTVCSVNYPWARTSLADAGTHVAADADLFARLAGVEKVHVVGHSLGGVVARWALGNTRLAEQTMSLTTLGSPHRGTPLAHLAPRALPMVGALLDQLRCTSADLATLPHPATLPHIAHTAVAGTLDVVVPAGCAVLPPAANVVNVTVPSGHIAMPASRRVARRVLQVLRTEPTTRAAA